MVPTIAGFISIWVIRGTTRVMFLISGQTVLTGKFEPMSYLIPMPEEFIHLAKDSPWKSG